MSIDTERLATDRAYWDSVAPEGATHYDPEDMGAPWMMETTRNWMFYWGSKKEWVEYAQKAMLTRILARLVIRPDAPEEWDGTGLPPVGVECEYLTAPREGQWNFAPVWENCVVKYASENGAFLLDGNRDEIFMDSADYDIQFRPIRTPEQREQEALALSIQNAMECVTRRRLHDEDSFAMANILTVAGYRKADDK